MCALALFLYGQCLSLCIVWSNVHAMPDAGDKVQKQSGFQPLYMTACLDCLRSGMVTGVITTKPIPVQQMMCIQRHGCQ